MEKVVRMLKNVVNAKEEK